jgi:hypothetical protein
MGKSITDQAFGRRRHESLTITLRIDDGLCEWRIVGAAFGHARAFRPVLGGSKVYARVRLLLDAIASEAQPATGGDVLDGQLTLFDVRGRDDA